MCFFNSQNRRAFEIARRYGRVMDAVEMAEEILREQGLTPGPSPNEEGSGEVVQKAFLHPECFIVTRDERLMRAKWGLIPFWVRDLDKVESIRNMTANARSETVFTQASFRHAIWKRRCLVPSTGFFEYHYLTPGSSTSPPAPPHRGGGKEKEEVVPYRIFLRDEEVFSLAGMFEEWKHPETKEIIRTFSVVTVAGNELCSFIHNGGRNPGRMPGIIPLEEESRWLDPGLTEKEILGLLRPYGGAMEAVEMEKDYLRRA